MSRMVAIYARVSTEHEAQISALENQVQYYDDILAKHPDWTLYDKYIDEGITGTSVKKRKSFLRMMEDAEKGCFDLIVTREVSRFARNTVDTLQETRRLKKMGIEVYFTEDNIWTMNDEDGELRLTIMATLAQNESKKTSMRVKAGQKISFQNAIPYGSGNILGYDRIGKEMVINPEQAETVKLIYKLYLEGKGTRKICYELEKRGCLTSTGRSHWEAANVARILHNPFYMGTIVYRKCFVPDYLEQKQKKNEGEVEQVIVEGKHQPLVSKEDYALVQEKFKDRYQGGKDKNHGRKDVENIWCKKLKCPCGSRFNKRVYYRSPKSGIKYVYRCHSQKVTGSVTTRKNRGLSIEGICDTPMVPEWKLTVMLHVLVDNFLKDRSKVLKLANDLLENNVHQDINEENIRTLKKYEGQLNIMRNKMNNLVDMRMGGEISKEVFLERKKKLEEETEKIQFDYDELSKSHELTVEEIGKKVSILKYAMEQDFNLDGKEIPDSIIDMLVNEVIVCKDDIFIWKLNFNDDNQCCLVKGNAWNPSAEVIGKAEIRKVDDQANDSTGRYKRTGEIRHKPYYLLTLICTEEDAFDHFSHSSQKYDIRRFDNIVFDVYV